MSKLAPTVQAFFTERLIRQRNASPHTIAAYRDTIRLLLDYTAARLGREPCELEVGQLDAPTITAFLDHLEHERGNAIRTRNARLAAIHSLFHYAAYRHPEHAADIQRVLAIQPKRFERALICFLDSREIEALINAPDRSSWTGRRDHALLVLAAQTGLRASEITGLRCSDVQFHAAPHVNCQGKGRKQRITPLTKTTTAVLRGWLTERQGAPEQPLFPTIHGRHLSRDALEQRIAKHAETATTHCASLKDKRITAHTLRHTAAMQLLHAGVETTVIALWLGHEQLETTQIYLHADLAIKERALARTTPPGTTPGRYKPPDTLLAFLQAL